MNIEEEDGLSDYILFLACKDCKLNCSGFLDWLARICDGEDIGDELKEYEDNYSC